MSFAINHKQMPSSDASRKRSPTVRHKTPHSNHKYEMANNDWILYMRTNRGLQWNEVQYRYNLIRLHLERYNVRSRDIREGRIVKSAGRSRHMPRRSKAEPERSSSGLQASYYRLRLAVPVIDKDGNLEFDPRTGEQLYTDCRVRRDNEKKVDLINMFPERVVFYKYDFVSAEDMAKARMLGEFRLSLMARRAFREQPLTVTS
jgi:hypothetical protein